MGHRKWHFPGVFTTRIGFGLIYAIIRTLDLKPILRNEEPPKHSTGSSTCSCFDIRGCLVAGSIKSLLGKKGAGSGL